MSENEQAKIFAKNLNRLLKERNEMQKDIAQKLGVCTSTFSTWSTGTKIPRMDKSAALADHFDVELSELLDNPKAEEPEKKLDIKAKIDELLSGMSTADALAFSGEVVDEETERLLRQSLEHVIEMAEVLNKKKK